MSDTYGYRLRPDMPDPFVTGGVDDPRNQWPRKVTSGLSGSSSVARTILGVMNSSNTDIMGVGAALGVTTTNGTVVATANGWDATWKRTGWLKDLTGTNPALIGAHRCVSSLNLSPAAMCQPNITGSAGYYAPFVFRLSDVVAARSTTMPAGGSAGASFGITNYATSPNQIPTQGFVGFVSTWADPDTYGTWSTWISNTGGTFTRATNLTASTNTPHLMEMEFDAPNLLINWYIDGSLVDSYGPSNGDMLTHSGSTSVSIIYAINATNTAVTRMMLLADTVPWCSVTMIDLDEAS